MPGNLALWMSVVAFTMILLLIRWAVGPVFSWWWVAAPPIAYILAMCAISLYVMIFLYYVS